MSNYIGKTTKRNQFEVLDKLHNALPTEEMKKELTQFIHPFRAPELYWGLMTVFVNRVISHPPKEDWEFKVLSILINKSIEQLRTELGDDI